MGLFSKPSINTSKPKWLREIEIEQQKKIRSALQAIRTTQPSKSAVNIMLHGSAPTSNSSLRALSNPGGWSYGQR